MVISNFSENGGTNTQREAVGFCVLRGNKKADVPVDAMVALFLQHET